MKFHAPIVAALIGALCVTPAAGQSYPAKPVRFVSSSAAGSPGDVLMRLLAAKMTPGLGQSVIVENRLGAGGTLAAIEVIRAGADGYSMLFSSNMIVVSRFILRNISLDVRTDLIPVSQAGSATNFLVVSASVPVNSAREFIDYAKQNPGALAFSNNGNGSALHMVGEAFKMSAGIDLRHVPYSAASNAVRLNDFLAGRIQVDWSPYNFIRPQLASGKIKVLAVLDRTRFRSLPDVPAITELVPNYQFASSYWGIWGPAGVPGATIARLEAEIRRAFRDAELTSKLEAIGVTPIGNSAQEFAAVLMNDIEVTERLAKLAGLQPE